MSRGTLELDRVFGKKYGNLGHLRVPSGTHDPELREKLNNMLTVLAESRPDIVTAMVAKRLAPLQVWAAFRVGNLASLPMTAEMLMPLAESMEQWKDALKNKRGEDASAKHKASLQISIGHLSRHGRTVGELPAALLAVKGEMLPDRKRTYQLVRWAALAFLRDLKGIGEHHQLYFDVANVSDVLVVPKRQKGVGILVFREKVAKLDPTMQAQAWAMAGTGMRVQVEYLDRNFEVMAGHVAIQSAKGAPPRVVPLVVPVTGPFTPYKPLHSALAAVGLQPHTLRRCFGRWCEEAGIPLSRIQAYMGHSSRSRGAGTTGLYLEHDVPPYLPDDEAKLRAYIGRVEIGLRLEKKA